MKAKFGKRALSLALILALAMATMLVPASAAPEIAPIMPESVTIIDGTIGEDEKPILQYCEPDLYEKQVIADIVESSQEEDTDISLESILLTLKLIDKSGDAYKTGDSVTGDEITVTNYELFPFYSYVTTEEAFFCDIAIQDGGGSVYYRIDEPLTVTIEGIEQLIGVDQEDFLFMVLDPETGSAYFMSLIDLDTETGQVTTTFPAFGPFALLINTKSENAFSFSYDAGGGEGTVKSTRYYYTGTEVTVEDGSNLTREGYTFAGWVDGNGTTYAAGETITVTENIALTATWEANNVSVPVKVNMTLANNLAMNFYISKNGDETESSYTLYVTKDGETVALEWLDGDELYASEGFSEFEGCWVARYTGCYAYEYASELTVTLKSGDEEVTMTNNTFNANGTLNISISAYLNKIVEIYTPYISYAIYEKEVTMANAVLTYCEAAKVYNG